MANGDRNAMEMFSWVSSHVDEKAVIDRRARLSAIPLPVATFSCGS